ncbi:MAG: tetratricopeptide repeat protein, partial [Nannocystaceae bacterium]
MSDAIDDVIDEGLKAVEAENLDVADEALEKAQGLGGENHVRVLHLHGLIAWAKGEIERAAGFLMQAVDLVPPRGEIYLDTAECLMALGQDLDEAEAVVRTLLQQEAVSADSLDQGRLLLAQIRLEDDDPEEALEILDTIRRLWPGLAIHGPGTQRRRFKLKKALGWYTPGYGEMRL